MNDGPSYFSGLQKEWSLLVHSFLEQESVNKKIAAKFNPQNLSLEQIGILNRDLSQGRKTLNQKIETVKGNIDRLASVLENLSLVGSNDEDVREQIEHLHFQGERLSSELLAVEQKIKRLHDIKDRLLKISETESQ